MLRINIAALKSKVSKLCRIQCSQLSVQCSPRLNSYVKGYLTQPVCNCLQCLWVNHEDSTRPRQTKPKGYMKAFDVYRSRQRDLVLHSSKQMKSVEYVNIIWISNDLKSATLPLTWHADNLWRVLTCFPATSPHDNSGIAQCTKSFRLDTITRVSTREWLIFFSRNGRLNL